MGRGQAEAVGAILIALLIAFAMYFVVKALQAQQRYIRSFSEFMTIFNYKRAEDMGFAYNATEGKVYARPTIDTEAVIRIVYSPKGVYYMNKTRLYLKPAVWNDLQIPKRYTAMIAVYKNASLAIISRYGNLFVFTPYDIPPPLVISNVTAVGEMPLLGEYNIYIAKTRPQQLLIANISVKAIQASVGTYSWYGSYYYYLYVSNLDKYTSALDMMNGLATVSPIIIFYQGPLNITEVSVKNPVTSSTSGSTTRYTGGLTTTITLTNIASGRSCTIQVTNIQASFRLGYSDGYTEYRDVVSGSCLSMPTSYNATVFVYGNNKVIQDTVPVRTLDGADFIVLVVSTRKTIATYTIAPGSYDIYLNANGKSIQIWSAPLMQLVYKNIVYNGSSYSIINSIDYWLFEAGGIMKITTTTSGMAVSDSYTWAKTKSPIYIVLVNPNTYAGRGAVIDVAMVAETYSRNGVGYLYNLDPPVTVTANKTSGKYDYRCNYNVCYPIPLPLTTTINNVSWNLKLNMDLTHWIRYAKTWGPGPYTLNLNTYLYNEIRNRSINVQSPPPTPPPTTTPTPPSSAGLISPPRIVYEQSPIPNSTAPIDTTIIIKTFDVEQTGDIVLYYEVYNADSPDPNRKPIDSGAATLSSLEGYAQWSYKLTGDSRKYIQIWVYYKGSAISAHIFLNWQIPMLST